MKRRLSFTLSNLLFSALLLTGAVLAAWLSQSYRLRLDLTSHSDNSFRKATLAALARLDKPLDIALYAPPNPQIRRVVADLISRLRDVKTDVEFAYVNTETRPDINRWH